MSEKRVDKYNRYRCVNVGFRLSPEEAEEFAYTSDIDGLKRDLEDIKRLTQEVLSVWQSLRYCT